MPPGAPVAERTTMLHAGTLVVHGTGRAVVVATGAASQLGRIARMLHEQAAPATPLQRRLAALGRPLSLLVTACCIVVLVLGLLQGRPWELTVGISLAAGAPPTSLPLPDPEESKVPATVPFVLQIRVGRRLPHRTDQADRGGRTQNDRDKGCS